MLNFSKFICVLSISCALTNASLLGDLGGLVGGLVGGVLNIVGNLLVPPGVNNVGENAKLCTLQLPGIVDYYGYKLNTTSVTTDDGYILTVHCVYNSSALDTTLNPVIAWHGLMGASNSFVINYPKQSLAFLLADRGYYVCLPNARGNGFSQGYVNTSRNSNVPINPYWEFSWDQIAQFDVPAVIDAVLDSTGKSKVIYIGYSQGSTTMFALLSTKPSYNDKVSIFAALAPVTYFSNTKSPLYLGASLFQVALDLLYGVEYSPVSVPQGLLTSFVCTLPTEELCKNLLFLAYGYSTHIDNSRLPVYMCYSPAGFSWGQFAHYSQLVKGNKFQKYDFQNRNQQMYGQPSPPEYDLTQITAKVALYHSSSDIIADDVDVETLKSQLRYVVREQHLNASVVFNHLDYLWAKDVDQIVYADLFDLIEDY